MAFTSIPTRTSSDTAIPYQDTNSLMANTQYFRDVIGISSGKCGIGTDSPVELLSNYTANGTTATAGDKCFYWGDNTASSYAVIIEQEHASGGGLFIQYNGGTGLAVRNESTSILDLLVSSSNVLIGGSAVRGTTAGTKHLDIFDGTAPAGTLTNGISFYSSSGEAYVMDAAGNATLLSPHDKENNWIYRSKDTTTGKVLKIDMEKMLKFLNDKFGTDFIHEYMEAV